MTREEEIKEMAKVKASHITSDKDMQVAFADALRRGAEWADCTMIDKACEWFEEKACCGWIEDVEVKYFIEDFRKAMKGEQI